MFHKTLEQLRQLQIIFNEKFNLERKISELPKEVDTHGKMVQQLKQEFLEKNERYNLLKQESFIKKENLQYSQKQKGKLEKEIRQVSSQRDYEKIDRAIKENEEFEHGLAKDLSNAEDNFEKFKEEFDNSEKFLKDQENLLETTKSQVKKQIVDVDAQLRKLKNKETGITGSLNENLVFKFERIIKTKGGGGIVPIRKNVCYGCNMLLPLQFVNLVRKEDEVLTCPYCSKIVFYDGSVDFEEVQTIEISGLQDIVSEDDIELDEFSDEDMEEFFNKDEIGSDAYVPSPNLEETGNMLASDKNEDADADDEDSEDGDDEDYDADAERSSEESEEL